jgi:p-aminobenzoyl-glutamate transporter AbgT
MEYFTREIIGSASAKMAMLSFQFSFFFISISFHPNIKSVARRRLDVQSEDFGDGAVSP